ncbi:MAG: amino acid ABC transporter permease [Actinobacteria bacterium 69-20]|nr:MAG: amino acid ABC transporter permease [Actinobacteria bacterium 69-20]
MVGKWLLRLAIFVLAIMALHLLITSDTIEWHVVAQYLTAPAILQGVITTLVLTAIAMIIGILLGGLLALMRLSNSLLLNGVTSLYLWFFRGTPLLVQILFWYNLASFIKRISIGIPFGPSFISWNTNDLISPLTAAILALGLNQAAYMCEIVRAGILGVDEGQLEASAALGMTSSRAFRRIVLPQAMRIIIPPTSNNAIGLLKDSSLVSVISMTELLYAVQQVYSRTFQTIPLLIVASIWYLMMTTVTSIGQYYIERHYGRGTRRDQRLSAVARITVMFRKNLLSVVKVG